MKIIKTMASADGAIKRIHQLNDGLLVESVVIPHKTKTNICISSQVGCKMKCTFCASGENFYRNLTAREIADQIDIPVDSVVFMGMGEPLDNPHLIDAIKILLFEKKIPPRKIVVSTSGLLDDIDKLIQMKINIAVSLNAATDEKRNKIMPINKKYDIQHLKNKLAEIKTKLPNRIRVLIEYVIIADFNDSVEDAMLLAKLIPAKSLINLIPVNSSKKEFKASSPSRMLAFKEEMRKHGFVCYIRESKGKDISAACGMLAGKS